MANSNVQLHAPSESKTVWAWVVGTFFGAGLLKPGPGTYGSISAVLLWYFAAHVLQPAPVAFAVGTAVAAVFVTLIGIPAATIVARESGREDPSQVVIDEVAGQLIALIAIPADWRHAAVSLLLFRFFDILKPPPARQLERLHGGTGIMMDDVAAGLFALAVAQLIQLRY